MEQLVLFCCSLLLVTHFVARDSVAAVGRALLRPALKGTGRSTVKGMGAVHAAARAWVRRIGLYYGWAEAFFSSAAPYCLCRHAAPRHREVPRARAGGANRLALAKLPNCDGALGRNTADGPPSAPCSTQSSWGSRSLTRLRRDPHNSRRALSRALADTTGARNHTAIHTHNGVKVAYEGPGMSSRGERHDRGMRWQGPCSLAGYESWRPGGAAAVPNEGGDRQCSTARRAPTRPCASPAKCVRSTTSSSSGVRRRQRGKDASLPQYARARNATSSACSSTCGVDADGREALPFDTVSSQRFVTAVRRASRRAAPTSSSVRHLALVGLDGTNREPAGDRRAGADRHQRRPVEPRSRPGSEAADTLWDRRQRWRRHRRRHRLSRACRVHGARRPR